MPLLVGAFIGALISAAGTIIGQVLISLGIGFVAYQGIDIFLIAAKQTFLGSLGLSPVIGQLAGVLQVGTAVNILASAMASRLVLAGLTSGTLKKMVNR
jgi:Protein of unknown function (DUF2523)